MFNTHLFVTNMKTQLPYRFVLLLTILFCTLPGIAGTDSRKQQERKLNFYIREVENDTEDESLIIPLCDSIGQISLNLNDTLTACVYLMRKGHSYQKTYNYEKAFETYEQVYSLCKDVDHTSPEKLRDLRTESLVLTIKTAYFLGHTLYSIEKCYELLAMEQRTELQLLGFSYLGLYMQEINNTQDALESIRQADRIFHETTDTLRPDVLKSYWNNKAGIYFYHQQTDSAIFCLNKALSYIDMIKKDVAQSNFNLNLARVYWQIGEYELAKHSYQRIFEDIRKVPTTPLHVQTIGDYSKLCLNMNQLDSARSYCLKALSLADSIDHAETNSKIQLLYSEILYRDGRYRESHDVYVEANRTLDSIHRKTANSTTLLLHKEFNNQKLKLEHKQLRAKHEGLLLKSHRIQLTLIVITLLLIGVTAGSLYAHRKKKQEQERHKRQNNEMQKVLQKAEQSMEKYAVDQKIQEEKLQSCQRAILLYENFLEEMERKLEEVSGSRTKEREDAVHELQDSINELKHKPGITACNSDMNQEIFDNFCRKIQTEYPILTEEDMQLCFFLAMNISQKDIASKLNKSVRTIEYKVYQLRKRIGIPSEVKTMPFFQGFL